MAKQVISNEIKEEAISIIEQFNALNYKKKDVYFFSEFRGKFLYLFRHEYGSISPIIRLCFTGDMNDWEAAIYKWSREKYDPEDIWFPGSQYLNGTILGALKAGMEA
jgi:hypothetical protein